MRLLFTVLVIMVILGGCNKQKNTVSDAADSASLKDSSNDSKGDNSASGKTQVATGEMRQLLLALKRVHFPFDSSTLGTKARDALDDAAEKLRSIENVNLYVDGHTDARGTTEYNMSLGEQRAKAVVAYLKNSGVEPQRLSTTSFGEENPIAEGSGTPDYALNRRVEFRILKGDVEFVLEDGDPVDDTGKPLKAKKARAKETTNDLSQ